MNPGSEMIEALYISNFDIFGVKSRDNQGKNKKFDILHCPFEKNAIEMFVFFVEKSLLNIWGILVNQKCRQIYSNSVR